MGHESLISGSVPLNHTDAAQAAPFNSRLPIDKNHSYSKARSVVTGALIAGTLGALSFGMDQASANQNQPPVESDTGESDHAEQILYQDCPANVEIQYNGRESIMGFDEITQKSDPLQLKVRWDKSFELKVAWGDGTIEDFSSQNPWIEIDTHTYPEIGNFYPWFLLDNRYICNTGEPVEIFRVSRNWVSEIINTDVRYPDMIKGVQYSTNIPDSEIARIDYSISHLRANGGIVNWEFGNYEFEGIRVGLSENGCSSIENCGQSWGGDPNKTDADTSYTERNLHVQGKSEEVNGRPNNVNFTIVPPDKYYQNGQRIDANIGDENARITEVQIRANAIYWRETNNIDHPASNLPGDYQYAKVTSTPTTEIDIFTQTQTPTPTETPDSSTAHSIKNFIPLITKRNNNKYNPQVMKNELISAYKEKLHSSKSEEAPRTVISIVKPGESFVLMDSSDNDNPQNYTSRLIRSFIS